MHCHQVTTKDITTQCTGSTFVDQTQVKEVLNPHEGLKIFEQDFSERKKREASRYPRTSSPQVDNVFFLLVFFRAKKHDNVRTFPTCTRARVHATRDIFSVVI
jgi:hypothetical protein